MTAVRSPIGNPYDVIGKVAPLRILVGFTDGLMHAVSTMRTCGRNYLKMESDEEKLFVIAVLAEEK